MRHLFITLANTGTGTVVMAEKHQTLSMTAQ